MKENEGSFCKDFIPLRSLKSFVRLTTVSALIYAGALAHDHFINSNQVVAVEASSEELDDFEEDFGAFGYPEEHAVLTTRCIEDDPRPYVLLKVEITNPDKYLNGMTLAISRFTSEASPSLEFIHYMDEVPKVIVANLGHKFDGEVFLHNGFVNEDEQVKLIKILSKDRVTNDCESTS